MAIATISVNFANAAEVATGTETAKSINPAVLAQALRSGSYGIANFQALTARQGIEAPTFKGSGRLLTDVFTVTGGPIRLSVGPGRQYNNLEAAMNSLSSFIFDTTANVIISAHPAVYTGVNSLNITHPYGNQIRIIGTTQPFRSIDAIGLYNTGAINTGTCIFGVTGGFTSPTELEARQTAGYVEGVSELQYGPLSAEFTYSSNVDHPSAGEYVQFNGVSGRDVSVLTYIKRTTSQEFLESAYVPGTAFNWLSGSVYDDRNLGYTFLDVGHKLILTKFNAGPATSITKTLRSSTTDTLYPVMEFYEANSGKIVSEPDVIAMIGTPGSWRGGRVTQAANSNTLTFLTDAGASDPTATKDWLNVGDEIYLLGQTRPVSAVGTNNTCRVTRPFCNGTATGFNFQIATLQGEAVAGAPYLVKTHFERYRGVHRITRVDRNARRCVIEVQDKTTTSGTGMLSPLPKWGVYSLGKDLATNGTINLGGGAYRYVYPEFLASPGFIHKTHIKTTDHGIYIHGPLGQFSNMLLEFELFGPTESQLRRNTFGLTFGLSDDGSKQQATVVRNLNNIGVVGYTFNLYTYPFVSTTIYGNNIACAGKLYKGIPYTWASRKWVYGAGIVQFRGITTGDIRGLTVNGSYGYIHAIVTSAHSLYSDQLFSTPLYIYALTCHGNNWTYFGPGVYDNPYVHGGTINDNNLQRQEWIVLDEAKITQARWYAGLTQPYTWIRTVAGNVDYINYSNIHSSSEIYGMIAGSGNFYYQFAYKQQGGPIFLYPGTMWFNGFKLIGTSGGLLGGDYRDSGFVAERACTFKPTAWDSTNYPSNMMVFHGEGFWIGDSCDIQAARISFRNVNWPIWVPAGSTNIQATIRTGSSTKVGTASTDWLGGPYVANTGYPNLGILVVVKT